jgi:hypothetical protein
MKLELILVLALAFSPACSMLLGVSEDSRIKAGKEIADKIESFRNEKGRTPFSLSEVGIAESEEGPIYYQRKGETEYILWFGNELGESAVYHSETRKWE